MLGILDDLFWLCVRVSWILCPLPPPIGTTHRNIFRLYALDAYLAFPAADRTAQAMAGHTLAETEFATTSRRQILFLCGSFTHGNSKKTENDQHDQGGCIKPCSIPGNHDDDTCQERSTCLADIHDG